MEIKNVIEKLDLSINYVELSEIQLNFMIKNESESEKLKSLFQQFLDTENKSNQRSVFYDEIIQIVRGQLKRTETVGEILDILKFSVKMLFVDCIIAPGITLLNEIFQLLPVPWNQDPVKIHLITKTIYETSNHDFNNTMFILNKIIDFNKLGFYVALTLFWSLYLHHFKKDTHHYYKMYDVNKFFKLLQQHDRDEQNNKEIDINTIFQLLLLISIYQSYVLFNEESASSHQVFQDFFKVFPHDRERLKTHLSKIKSLVEIRYPVSWKQTTDALMLVEFLELDLMKSIDERSNQHTTIEKNNVAAVDCVGENENGEEE
ncbi:hypothetical protein PVAND_008304 [Polypedilum vanderplanki]|uniref:Uncharacterized protein n=1 Tax=Polypedilum vanderplanki TaxID=319348 RepID=A0A9J6C9S6_POLVA|nr:hypothetical protein PVAND_008304 [Polypedilum vanderplanki]